MPDHGLVSWNAMISGCTNSGLFEEALGLFYQMQSTRIEPNILTLASVLKACSGLTALSEGRTVHSYFIESGLECNEFIGSALIELYSKCGSLAESTKLFEFSPSKERMSIWSAMIGSYALRDDCESAFRYFEDMQQLEGLKPDATMFVSILSACGHAGRTNEASSVFDSMVNVHGFTPVPEHYTCLVDALGRAGMLSDADDLLRCMPLLTRDSIGCISMLTSCRTYGTRGFENLQLPSC
jgi:pentatricopeptide repeat protein